jgi:hypothetical protein
VRAVMDLEGTLVRESMRFMPDSGAPGYYDRHGRSIKRFFLASPLKFNRS